MLSKQPQKVVCANSQFMVNQCKVILIYEYMSYYYVIIQMEIHKRKLKNPPRLKIGQDKSSFIKKNSNNVNNTGLSLSMIQNNDDQNNESDNPNQSLLNDFQMLLTTNQISNKINNQSKLVIQKQTFYKKYQDALVCLQAKNQQSYKRALGILNSLALKLKKQSAFLQLVDYNILENVVFNLWKTYRQIGILTSKLQGKLNLIQFLVTLQNIVKLRKLKETKLGSLCLIIAKQFYENNEFVQALEISQKGLKYCPRNRNISLLLKIHYLKSKIYNKIQAFQLQGEEIKKCIFFMNNLNQNVQKKQFGQQFLRMLINRKEQLKKSKKQKTVLFKERETNIKSNSVQYKSKFRTKSISLSKLKYINSNNQQKNMEKTVVKIPNYGKKIQQKMNGQTKKMFLKLDINNKSKLKKKVKTIWQKNAQIAELQTQKQKIGLQLQKISYDEEQTKKYFQMRQKYPIDLISKRPNQKKTILKVTEKKEAVHQFQQQQIAVNNQEIIQQQVQLNSAQNMHTSHNIKPQNNLKGLIHNMQNECLQKYLLKNSIGLNKLQQWDEDSQQMQRENQQDGQKQQINNAKSTKFDYQTQHQVFYRQIQSIIFQQLLREQIIFSNGVTEVIKIQLKLDERKMFEMDDAADFIKNSQQSQQNIQFQQALIINAKLKVQNQYYKVRLVYQFPGYSAKQMRNLIKSKQNIYKWIIKQKRLQLKNSVLGSQQSFTEQKSLNSFNYIRLDQLDKNLQDELTFKILSSVKFQKHYLGKRLKQIQQKQFRQKQQISKSRSFIYTFRENTFQFYRDQENLFNHKNKINKTVAHKNNQNLSYVYLQNCQKDGNCFEIQLKQLNLQQVKFLKTILIYPKINQTQQFISYKDSNNFENATKSLVPTLFIKKILRNSQKQLSIPKIKNLMQLYQNFEKKQIFSQIQTNKLENKRDSIQGVIYSQKQQQIKTNVNKNNQSLKIWDQNLSQIERHTEEILKEQSQQVLQKIQNAGTFQPHNLLASLLKKILIQPDCQKSEVINTYYQFIVTSSIFRLMSNRSTFVKVKCFRMKNIYIQNPKDKTIYYLFQLQEQQTRTRMAKFIIQEFQVKKLFFSKQLKFETDFSHTSLSNVLNTICPHFVLRKSYIYSRIGLEFNNDIFYFINKFRIKKAFNFIDKASNSHQNFKDLIKEIILQNIPISNPQFVDTQIKIKKILSQKSILIKPVQSKNNYGQHKTYFGVLSVQKIQQSSYFTLRVYLPHFQRTFSINLSKQIFNYLSNETLLYIFSDLQNISSSTMEVEQLTQLMFESQKVTQTKIWNRLVQRIVVQEKVTEHKKYLIVKIDSYHAFLKDSSSFNFFQAKGNIYQIQMTLQKSKKQDINSPNNISQPIEDPKSSIRNKCKFNRKQDYQQNSQQNKYKENNNSCFQKVESIYQSQTPYFILYLKISHVYTIENRKTKIVQTTNFDKLNKNDQNSKNANIVNKMRQFGNKKEIYKKNKKIKINKHLLNKQKVQSLNISFYLSELLDFLKQQSQNYSFQFNQSYFTQAELQNFFKLMKKQIIEEFNELNQPELLFSQKSLVQFKKSILNKLIFLNKNHKMQENEKQKKKTVIKSFISLNTYKQKNIQGPRYLNLSVLSNQKRKILSIFHFQNKLLFLITNSKSFQVKKLFIDAKGNCFPFLQILQQKDQLKVVNKRLLKYYKNKLQIY